MSVAQKLFESGKITYMRTDSTNLSETALSAAAAYISGAFGKEYSHPTQYATKNNSAQEAHEAIRPTYMDHVTVDGTRDEQRLYDLIWKRTVASQMSKAKLEKTIVSIDVSGRTEQFVAEGEVVKFPGFLKVYLESTDDEEDQEGETAGILPPVQTGQSLQYDSIEARQRFSQPPPRFTEASLVKRLEELGIGRPSTYAPTISTIQQRGYVKKETKEGQPRDVIVLKLDKKTESVQRATVQESTGSLKGKLLPTDIGILVNDYLTDHFSRVMDFNFTAQIEKELDKIQNRNRFRVRLFSR
jgi:DNA topoisomerase-1